MGSRSWRFGMLSGAVVVLLATTGLTAAHGADYPTWDDIEAARADEAATAATIAQLDALLDGLQAEAARLGDEAVARAAESATASAAADAAEATAERLAREARDAAQDARRSAEVAAQFAAALYRSGGSDVTTTLLVSGAEESDDLLYRLGALGRVGEQAALALERAELDRNTAQSLSDQAAVARDERDRLATEAQEAADRARAAADSADAAVADQQARLTLLYEQLASLKGTTVWLEQQYRIGQGNSGPGAGGGSGGGSGGGGSGGGGFVVPGNEVNDVAAAQYFAMVQLASMGFGSSDGNCLIWLWNRESGWRTNAYNASSGAYGIPQALPGSKMANYAADWRTNYQTQVMWGLIYISGRYGSPCAAWAHSEATGWY